MMCLMLHLYNEGAMVLCSSSSFAVSFFPEIANEGESIITLSRRLLYSRSSFCSATLWMQARPRQSKRG